RDTTQWSQLILLAVLVVVYVFNIKALPLHRGEPVGFFYVNLVSFLNLGLAGFVLASIAARFIFPAVSLEGRQMWLLRSSPLDLKALLWSKYWVGTVPLLVLALLLTGITNVLLQVSRAAARPRAAAHRHHERAAAGLVVHDGREPGDDLRADAGDLGASARLRRAVPAVRDRECGPDPDLVRRPGVHDDDGRAAGRRDSRVVAGGLHVRPRRVRRAPRGDRRLDDGGVRRRRRGLRGGDGDPVEDRLEADGAVRILI